MSDRPGRLEGKVAIITGASTGCGPVMAEMFVREGARVLMVARSEDLVTEAARKIGKDAIAMKVDVTNEADVSAMGQRAMDEFGQIDILLNNAAASGKDSYLWEQTVENWNFTLGIDLTAAMICTREVITRSMMERKKGSIINFSSVSGWAGHPRKSHYATAKGALRALTKTTALELGSYGIRCNCLAPGSIDTEVWKNWGKRLSGERGITFETWREEMVSQVPLKTVSTPEDVGYLALYLASDESRTITGQTINCDAGFYMVG